MRVPDVRYHLHESELLKDNPLGDPNVRRVPVYVPPGYDEGRAEPYPVVYMLAGWSGRGAKYLEDGGAFSEGLPDRLDRMTLSGELKPTVIVFPDCATRLGASQYVNSPGHGPYMDYLCDELVPYIETQHNVYRDPDHRGIVGHSSGGFGALVTGMKRPDTFRCVCSSAGDSWYDFLYVQPIPMMVRVLAKAGGVVPFIEHYLSSVNPWGLLPMEEGLTMMCLNMCTCYAPNPDVPLLRGDLYFDLETGAVIPEVFERIRAWDPVLMVDSHVDALRSLRWLHLEAGTDDEYGLHLGHRQLAERLRAHGIEPVVDEYPGKHGGHHWRMGNRTRRIVDAMG